MFRRIAPIVASCLLCMCAGSGCPGIDIGGGSGEDGNLDPNVTSPLGKTRGEPNNTFDAAIVAVFNAGDVAQLAGRVSASGDVDIYNLGALLPGDRVVAQTSTRGSTLDTELALFDDQGRLFVENDDINFAAGNADSRLDAVIRWSAARYFLAIVDSPLALSSGSYQITVTVERGVGLPPLPGQTVYLDFTGGTIVIPGLSPISTSGFDAAAIDPIYRGEDDAIKRGIVETVEQNFRAFNLTVLSSDFVGPPAGDFSRVLFGGFNMRAFGISQSVDSLNSDANDESIIFTESFAPDVFTPPAPTAAEMGIAIGNITAHELGHLLGLNHVDDDLDIMDTSSPADAFLFDQEFLDSPLNLTIFPLGTQDSALLLEATLGPR